MPAIGYTVEEFTKGATKAFTKEVSNMRKKVAFISVSDLHLSHEAPKARAEKGEDWYKVMQKYLEQLAALKEELECEVVYAGDIFDTWQQPSELVNFVIKHMPRGYAIPGQHDLPYHRRSDIEKSPYWTLVKAGVLEDLAPGTAIPIGYKKPVLFGFPWGTEVTPRPEIDAPSRKLYGLQVAVIHAYCWSDMHTKYPGATNESHVRKWGDRLHGYDVAVFGDNHKGFITTLLLDGHHVRCNVLNNGHFIRRTRDDKNAGAVGLVYENGSVERVMLDCKDDKWVDDREVKAYYGDPEVEEAVRILKTLGRQGANFVDFRKILLRSLDNENLTELAKEVIVEALERGKR